MENTDDIELYSYDGSPSGISVDLDNVQLDRVTASNNPISDSNMSSEEEDKLLSPSDDETEQVAPIQKGPVIVGPHIDGRPRSPLHEKNEFYYDGLVQRAKTTIPFCRVRVFARYVLESATRGYIGTHQTKEFSVSVTGKEEVAWRSKHFLQYIVRQCSGRAQEEYPMKLFDSDMRRYEMVLDHITYRNKSDGNFTIIPESELGDDGLIHDHRRPTPFYTREILGTKLFDFIVIYKCHFSEPLVPVGRIGRDTCPERVFLSDVLKSIMREDQPMEAMTVAINAYQNIKSEYQKFRENLVSHRSRLIYNPKCAPLIWATIKKIDNDYYKQLREAHNHSSEARLVVERIRYQQYVDETAAATQVTSNQDQPGTEGEDHMEVVAGPSQQTDGQTKSDEAAHKAPKSKRKSKSKNKNKQATPTDPEPDVKPTLDHAGSKRSVPPANSMVATKKPKMSAPAPPEVKHSDPVVSPPQIQPLSSIVVQKPDFLPQMPAYDNGHKPYVGESRLTYAGVAQAPRGRGRGSYNRGHHRGNPRGQIDDHYAQMINQKRQLDADLANYAVKMSSQQLQPHRGQPQF